MKIAYSLPETILTNEELSALYPEWPPEKIFSKTGIASRHVVAENETAVDLAERAAKKRFAEFGVSASDIDLVLLCTQSPDYNVFTRRYIYPLLTDFAPYVYGRGGCLIAEDMGRRVLTLPTYYGLKTEDVTTIAEITKELVK